MDVKDIGRRVVKDALSPVSLSAALRKSNKAVVSDGNKDKVDVTSDTGNQIPPDIRKNLNEAISSINVAADATNSIGSFLSSIGGVLEQAQKGDLSPQRTQALEAEANQLINAIKNTAREVSKSSAGVINNDVRSEVEAKIGKTLDVLLPEDATDAFGIGAVSFSRKEAIIQTITNVTAAQRRIDEVRKSVQESSDSLKNAVLSFDVAAQNNEASRANVRDVETAAKLLSDTKLNIVQDPNTAINSVGNLVVKSLDLLK